MTSRPITASGVLATYYRIAGLHTFSASLVWAIHTLFFLDAGLDLMQVFLVHATYTAGITLFEIPTGVVADLRGRRTSLLCSTVALAFGTAIYLLGTWAGAGLMVFCSGALVLAIGTTFYSGALEAWLVDSLEQVDPSRAAGSLEAVLARGQVITSASSLVGTVAGGLLASLHLAGPYVVRLLLLAVALGLVFFGMKESTLERRPASLAHEIKRLAGASIVYGWRHQTVRLLVVAGLLHYGFLTWAFHAWQPYLLAFLEDGSPWIIGVVSALMTLATMAGNALVGMLTRSRDGRRIPVLLTASAVLTLTAIGVGLAGSFGAALVLILGMSAAWGIIGPVKQAWLHRVIPSEQRATVISFDSLVSNAGSAAGQGGLGYLARTWSLAAAFIVGGLVTVLVLPILVWLRRSR